MLKAPVKPDEQDRLNALLRYRVLDSEAEKLFDDITALASAICGTPIALISLVDQDRQWFKSKVGLAAEQTPRDISFCGHAIHDTEVFEVSDAWHDVRFVDNPLVTGQPHVRFYAGAPLVAPNGHAIGTLCVIDHEAKVMTDEQKHTLKILARQVIAVLELRLLEAKQSETITNLDMIFDSMTEGLVVHDKSGAIVQFNHAALSILGLTANQLAGRDSMDPTWRTVKENGEDFPGKDHPAIKALTTGQPQQNTLMGVYQPNGELRWIRISAVPIFKSGPTTPSHSLVTFVDVSESIRANYQQKELQAQLTYSAKMSTLGEMAAGIAHEINNPLSIIQGKSNRIRKMIHQNTLDLPKIDECLSVVDFTVNRIAGITKGLLNFSRDGSDDLFLPVLMQKVIDDSLVFCHSKIVRSNVDIRLDPHASQVIIQAREVQLTQILVNLLNNSLDAISGLAEKWIALEIKPIENGMELSVTDSGPGIAKDIAEKIFQPFFTSKDIGQGTGLGLSISKGIAESHKGTLTLDASCPHTRFVLRLPLKQSLAETSPALKQVRAG